MTAQSELFVTETVAETMFEKYPELRDEVDHLEVPSAWEGYDDEGQFPDTGEAEVWAPNKRIGYITWRCIFSIAKGINGRYIEVKETDVNFRRDEGKEITL